jgi:ribosomal protein S24E
MKRFGKKHIMENKKITKKEIKEKIVEIFDVENRSMNIREITNLLNERFGMIRSQPIIRNYLDELIKEEELKLQKN